MEALSEAMASKPSPGQDMDGDFSFDENDGDDIRFHNSCLEELDRYRRTDEWLPSYHNILSRTALDCTRILSTAGVIDNNPSHLIQYTRDGTADELRLCAFSNLFDMGLSKNNAVLRWFLFAMGTDPSSYFRSYAFRLFGRILASTAIGQEPNPSRMVQQQNDGLIIEQEASTEIRKADLERRTTVIGALKALKAEVQANETLKNGLWTVITSPTLSFPEIKELLDICQQLYDPESSMVVKLRYPRYWQCKKVGKGKLHFSHSDRVRTTPMPKRLPLSLPAPPAPTLQTSLPSPSMPKIKSEGSGGSEAMPPPPQGRKPLFKPPRRPSDGEQWSARPSPMAETRPATPTADGEKPKLKIKLKIGPPKSALAGGK